MAKIDLRALCASIVDGYVGQPVTPELMQEIAERLEHEVLPIAAKAVVSQDDLLPSRFRVSIRIASSFTIP